MPKQKPSAQIRTSQAKTDEQLRKTDKQLRELKAQQAETSAQIRTSQAKTDEQLRELKAQQAETSAQIRETDRQLRELKTMFGNAQNNQGQMVEEFLSNTVAKTKNLWGIQYDYIHRNLKGHFHQTQGEFDIVLQNGSAVAIIEVKSTANINDLDKFPQKIANFRILFPMFQKYQIYIGIASLNINSEVIAECEARGYGVLKIAGDSIEEIPAQKAF